jgi:hypothetical protein
MAVPHMLNQLTYDSVCRKDANHRCLRSWTGPLPARRTAQRCRQQDQHHREGKSHGVFEFVGEREPRRLGRACDTVEPPELYQYRKDSSPGDQVPATQRGSPRAVRQVWV